MSYSLLESSPFGRAKHDRDRGQTVGNSRTIACFASLAVLGAPSYHLRHQVTEPSTNFLVPQDGAGQVITSLVIKLASLAVLTRHSPSNFPHADYTSIVFKPVFRRTAGHCVNKSKSEPTKWGPTVNWNVLSTFPLSWLIWAWLPQHRRRCTWIVLTVLRCGTMTHGGEGATYGSELT